MIEIDREVSLALRIYFLKNYHVGSNKLFLNFNTLYDSSVLIVLCKLIIFVSNNVTDVYCIFNMLLNISNPLCTGIQIY